MSHREIIHMKVKEKKTVRFAALVEAAGQPEYATLWTKPEQDRDFMRAVKEDRIVTLIQRNVGTKKDYGLVGFFLQKNAGFLVFPRGIEDRKSTRLNSSHLVISYAVFCLKKKKIRY